MCDFPGFNRLLLKEQHQNGLPVGGTTLDKMQGCGELYI